MVQCTFVSRDTVNKYTIQYNCYLFSISYTCVDINVSFHAHIPYPWKVFKSVLSIKWILIFTCPSAIFICHGKWANTFVIACIIVSWVTCVLHQVQLCTDSQPMLHTPLTTTHPPKNMNNRKGILLCESFFSVKCIISSAQHIVYRPICLPALPVAPPSLIHYHFLNQGQIHSRA